MRRLIAFTCALGLLATAGCANKSGGPGASGSIPDTLAIVQPENSFRLETPVLTTKLKHGESKAVSIGIRRGTNMSQNVSLKFADVPAGLYVDPKKSTLKNTETETVVMLTAAENAPVGDFVVRVIGHPPTGADAVSDLKVAIEQR